MGLHKSPTCMCFFELSIQAAGLPPAGFADFNEFLVTDLFSSKKKKKGNAPLMHWR